MSMAVKRKHPKFLRPNFGRSSRSRIKKAWRRQRGIDNKKRLKIAYMGASPSIGNGQPSEIMYFHPIGMPEALVHSLSELTNLKGVAVRIASGVGRKKRLELIKMAESMKLPVLNKEKKYPVKQVRKKAAKPEEKKEAKAEKKPEQAPEEKKEGKTIAKEEGKNGKPDTVPKSQN